MENSKRAVYVKCLAPIKDVIELFGPIPQVFTRCFVCNREAKYIACCLDDELSKRTEHGCADQAAEALVQYLRADCGTNFELPVCETHCDEVQ
jgi:hypothetical protein